MNLWEIGVNLISVWHLDKFLPHANAFSSPFYYLGPHFFYFTKKDFYGVALMGSTGYVVDKLRLIRPLCSLPFNQVLQARVEKLAIVSPGFEQGTPCLGLRKVAM